MVRRRKTTTAKRVYKKRRSSALKVKVNANIAREIAGIIYLALGIAMILSLKGAFGVIGNFMVDSFRPILGWGIYLVPGVFIFVSILLFFSKKIHFGGTKTLGVFLFLFSVLSVFHLSVPIDQIHEYARMGEYGGYVGFVSSFLFLEILGIGGVGAAIIYIAMFLVSLLLIFELSLKEIARFLIPEIQIEVSNNKKDNRILDKKTLATHVNEIKDSDFDALMHEFNQPEITIHKGANKNKKNIDTVSRVENSAEDQMAIEFENGAVGVPVTLDGSPANVKINSNYEWEFPSLSLLDEGDSNVHVDEKVLRDKADTIKKKLAQFGINVVMRDVNVGPTVIQFTLKPHDAVKLSKITVLKNDLALALAAERIRIEAPIPGKSVVGIEVPNSYRAVVHMKELLESAQFTDAKSKLTLPLGRDVSGQAIVANLETMPHLLIAGSTGSGKSVCMNSFLMALLYQNSPKDLNLIMIDPKRVELTTYNNIPHLLTPVIEDPEKAAISLRWVVSEMSRRYSVLSKNRVRNVNEYNELGREKMSRIVVIIDELADLMMAAGKEVEASICRIAQMARAVGIHLIIATQRPSVDVITGLIKANIPTRIAFAVSSSIDSRTIIDGGGAEDLLGRGDMLYLPTGMNKPVRIQGIYVSTKEIERVTNRIKLTVEPEYDETITSVETANTSVLGVPDSKASNDDDPMYEKAYLLVKESRKASASLLQRRLKVGYARAARLIDMLEDNGVVGPANGSKPRKIMIS